MEVRVAEIHHGVSKITQFQNIWIQHEAEMNWMKLPPCFAALIVSNELWSFASVYFFALTVM